DDLTAGVSYAVWQPGLTGTSFTVNTLTPTHSYRAWLRAVDANGGGPWSAANFSAAAPLAAPVIRNPAGDPATGPWHAPAGATGANYVIWQTGLTGTSFTVLGLTSGHTYSAAVFAVNGFGESPYSNAVVFTID